MKKKSIVFSVIVLIVLIPILINLFSKVIEPDKVLFVGQQIDEYQGEFTKEIKDKQKILEFENIFDDLNFVKEEWYPEKPADLIFRLDHKDGIFTHFYKVWIDDKEAIVLSAFDSENDITEIAKLSNEKLNDLESIIK
ncbi:hypothetical protein SAMN05421839_1724 [Halolactibacillus halophilus]|uniref:Uncharacterized protein n=1 Tax=Halolactibacillus halophilus TaxID=306540 RepID=A0A1I5TBQ2_9BACI|nr:hypothetical protein [Halolactibacillus halophilus]GEM02942.1 hypothetical protein HHA03_24740 [Halolactibacillus halophilus]SFP80251.1 hypothetical protein SAMN05421839_1724 [Halolactibacillus halophilus]